MIENEHIYLLNYQYVKVKIYNIHTLKTKTKK